MVRALKVVDTSLLAIAIILAMLGGAILLRLLRDGGDMRRTRRKAERRTRKQLGLKPRD